MPRSFALLMLVVRRGLPLFFRRVYVLWPGLLPTAKQIGHPICNGSEQHLMPNGPTRCNRLRMQGGCPRCLIHACGATPNAPSPRSRHCGWSGFSLFRKCGLLSLFALPPLGCAWGARLFFGFAATYACWPGLCNCMLRSAGFGVYIPFECVLCNAGSTTTQNARHDNTTNLAIGGCFARAVVQPKCFGKARSCAVVFSARHVWRPVRGHPELSFFSGRPRVPPSPKNHSTSRPPPPL